MTGPIPVKILRIEGEECESWECPHDHMARGLDYSTWASVSEEVCTDLRNFVSLKNRQKPAGQHNHCYVLVVDYTPHGAQSIVECLEEFRQMKEQLYEQEKKKRAAAAKRKKAAARDKEAREREAFEKLKEKFG